MNQQRIDDLVAAAVGRSFQDWAGEHPALATVIDGVALTDRVVDSLRQSPEYQQALADFYRDQNDLNLLNQLVQLAGPILSRLLAG